MKKKIYREFADFCFELICEWSKEDQENSSQRSLRINDWGFSWLEHHYPNHATRAFANDMIDFAIEEMDKCFSFEEWCIKNNK